MLQSWGACCMTRCGFILKAVSHSTKDLDTSPEASPGDSGLDANAASYLSLLSARRAHEQCYLELTACVLSPKLDPTSMRHRSASEHLLGLNLVHQQYGAAWTSSGFKVSLIIEKPLDQPRSLVSPGHPFRLGACYLARPAQGLTSHERLRPT